MSPQAEATAFELRVRWELDAADFDCAECGHACDAAPCGWAAGASTHFLRDEAGRAVARLTNDTHQHGTLWARQPQPYEGGFTANFSFRVHGMSVCTKALELFGVNTTAAASRAGVPFTPMADLVAAGEEITHYLVDHPDLPFEQLPPPRGVPPQLADEIDDAENANPDARYGRHTPTRGGRPAFAPYIGLEQRCPDDAGRVGGEGFAFVLQAEGLDAAGCNGTGVGYAAGGGDGCVGVASSVAIQFDTHHNARTVRSEECVDYDSVNKVCNPGGLKVRDTLQFDRQHAVSVFLDGDNAATSALKTVLLSHTVPMALDDGREHEVVVEYVPPPSDRVGAEGALQVFYDGADQPLLHLPITRRRATAGAPRRGGDFATAVARRRRRHRRRRRRRRAVQRVGAPRAAWASPRRRRGERDARHPPRALLPSPRLRRPLKHPSAADGIFSVSPSLSPARASMSERVHTRKRGQAFEGATMTPDAASVGTNRNPTIVVAVEL